jgi:hypothetical protein
MMPKPSQTTVHSIGILLFIGALTGAGAQNTHSDQIHRQLKVCDVLDDLDKLNGKTISIVGYLEVVSWRVWLWRMILRWSRAGEAAWPGFVGPEP